MSERQSKSTQDRHERILNELAKSSGNDICADCGTRNPRWASHSLGVFLCIRCAGIHRKMGTHISKIKSITMDQWSSEQIEAMRNSGGNTTVNNIVNPTNQSIPITSDDDHSMEKYIRAKWEKRLFMTPKRTVQSVVQAPPKRSSSVPTHMHPKDDVLIQAPVVQQQSPRIISQQITVLTDEQKVEQLFGMGFSDRNLNMEALRRAGGNIDIAATVLKEARTNMASAQFNPFSAQVTSTGFASQNQLQQTASIGCTSQQQAMNGVFVSQQQQQQQQQPQESFSTKFTSQAIINTGAAPQQPDTPFNLQQTPTFPFTTTQQQNTSSPFTGQTNPNIAPSSVNVNDPFGLSKNNFSGAQFNSSPAISAFNPTPTFGNNMFQQTTPSPSYQQHHTATNSNPFSQTGAPFNMQNQPMHSSFVNQPVNNMMSNPWSTQTYFN